ncbi:MAG: hypothetical protein ACRD1S_17530 [Vicinamibacterales bacterium]
MGRLLRAFKRLVWRVVKLSLVALVLLLLWVWFANPYQEAPPAACAARPPIGLPSLEAKAPGYQRPESSTYLTFPERYLAYNAHEYAQTLAGGRPSRFPYFRSIAQFWRGYYRVFKIAQAKYGFSARDHLVPVLIGLGFTAENAVKGVYESTIGRLTEQFSDGGKSDEDQYATRLAAEYAKFVRAVPFYEFAYSRALRDLWRTPVRGAHQARKLERRTILSIEYVLKAGYGWLIGTAANGDAPSRIHALALVNRSPELISIPRDETFTAEVSALVGKGVTIFEISGNDEIFLTALAPANRPSGQDGSPLKPANTWRVEFVEPVLTEPAIVRIGLTVPTSCLGRVLGDLQSSGATLERVYPY